MIRLYCRFVIKDPETIAGDLQGYSAIANYLPSIEEVYFF